MSTEMGKPLREARGETARAAQILRFAASEAFRPVGEHFEQSLTGAQVSTRRRPVGVVGLITPWNFPIAIPIWKLAPALIYGNTVVLKLAYEAPVTGLHIAEAFAEAELPAGVLNVLTGRGSTVGAALVDDPRVRAISFTGSVATGHGVRDEATKTGKRVQLELGGHNPMIVMDDADLGRAVEAAYAGAFWSAGQKCTATRRIYVQDAVYDTFREQFLARIDRGRVGDPLDPEVEVGPIVNETQFDEIVAAIERGRSDGGTVIAGGERADDAWLPDRADGVRRGRRQRVPLVRGGVRAGRLAVPLHDPRRGADARECGGVRPLDGDLHLEPGQRHPVHRRGAGRVDPRQLADRRRRGARALRRHQGERLRPARAGPRGDRVLHRDGHRLRRRVSANDERFLVTGAHGCIGAWTCAVLAESGASVVGFDLGTDDRRLRLVGAGGLQVVRGDITDRAALDRVLDEHRITHVIHLAALLIPQIKANPPLGTAINLGGTVNVLDAAKSRGIRVAYASSAAVFSQVDDTGGPVRNDAVGHPTTFYGVHKQACEGMARIFWQEEQVASIGIRPFIVYGPGRDSGLTASPSLAMAAAARGEGSQIAFGGRTQLQFAPDTARVFVAAARAATEGARVFNLGGPADALSSAAQAIEEAASVSCTVDEATLLPFPAEFDNGTLEDVIGPITWTPLAEGVRQTIDRLRAWPG